MSSDASGKFDVKGFALELRQDIQQNRIRLPTLPNIALEALMVVNDDRSSMADVARIINKDTSMATRLVRYANSPLYRGINTVASVNAAVMRIGLDTVRHAILSLAMRDVFSTSFESIEVRMEALWQHSVKVAAKAALLAVHFPDLNREEAMLAGLIHDVGAIPILLQAKDHPLLLDDDQMLDKLIRVLHMNVGKFILSHWNFDQALVNVAASHDRIDREPLLDEVDYVDIVQVANILSHEADPVRYSDLDQAEVPAFKRVGLDLIAEVRDMSASGAEMEIGTALY